jgi:hypothetical protein
MEQQTPTTRSLLDIARTYQFYTYIVIVSNDDLEPPQKKCKLDATVVVDFSKQVEFNMFIATNSVTGDVYKVVQKSGAESSDIYSLIPPKASKYIHTSSMMYINSVWHFAMQTTYTTTIEDFMNNDQFKNDDKYNSDKRMSIVMMLINVASCLEQENIEYDWSLSTIYWLGDKNIQLNPLGIRKCRGKNAAMDQKQKLIPVFRYILTGDQNGVVCPEQEYVFKQWNKVLLIEDILVTRFVFNHVKMLGFWTSAANYLLATQKKDKDLGHELAHGKELERLKDSLNYTILTGHNRLLHDWLAPPHGYSRCSRVATAVGFSMTKFKGGSVASFSLFMRDFQEHWKETETSIERMKQFFERRFKMSMEDAPYGQPTYFYRYVRQDFEMIFIKFFKVLHKHLAEKGCTHLIFK